MNGDWKEITLRDVIEKFIDYRGKTPKKISSGIPLVTAKIVKNGRIEEPNEFIAPEDYDTWMTRGLPEINDIILTTEAPLGELALIKDSNIALAQRIITLRVNNKLADHRFIKLLFESDYGQGLLQAKATGTTVLGIKSSELKKLKIKIPPLPTQRKIASILSAYDDLIENNLKRIKLLEEKAQLTYEEWFVRMKFPGYEAAAINKETGLPEGWKKGKLSDLIGYQSGFAYKSAKFTDEGFPVIKIKNIDNNTIDTSNTNFIDEEYALQTEKFKLNEGDLLIAMTGATVGKVGIVPITKVPCYLNQRVGRFLKIGEIDNTSFVNNFFSIGGGLNHVLNIAGGAAQPNISAKQILSIDSVIPSLEILERFSDLAISSTKENLNLQKQNQLLKEARDILLPRLMTGMIDVKQMNLENLQPTTA